MHLCNFDKFLEIFMTLLKRKIQNKKSEASHSKGKERKSGKKKD